MLPDADTFVWAMAPTNNYGGSGALSVSGIEATNLMGVQNGLFDSLLRFPLSNVVVSLNNDLGTGGWVVTQALNCSYVFSVNGRTPFRVQARTFSHPG